MSNALANVAFMEGLIQRFGIQPEYEHVLECTYRRLISPGATVVDIGAHAGRHSASFAELVGPTGAVHAFEPLPLACGYFRSRGLGPQVVLHQQAVAERNGMTSFVFAAGSPEKSGLAEKTYNDPGSVRPERIEVAVSPLDDFIDQFDGLQFVKIDAEGAELECIRSARQTIARFRPYITVEYGQPAYSAFDLARRDLFDLAASLGYHVGDLFGATIDTLAEWERICDRAYWDWYLIPGERLAPWRAALSFGEPDAAPALRADLAIIRLHLVAYDRPRPIRHTAHPRLSAGAPSLP